MVGLPLLVGSKSVASRYISLVQPIEVFDTDDVVDDKDHHNNNTDHRVESHTEVPSNGILHPSSLISCGCGNEGDKTSATIVTATSPDQELLAVITIYYYNMLRLRRHRPGPDVSGNITAASKKKNKNDEEYEKKEEEEVAYCVAELHIQISFLGRTTSITGRDSIFRIPLWRRSHDNNGDSSRGDPTIPSPHHHQHHVIPSFALFSSDQRYLSCLIAHPTSSSSSSSSSLTEPDQPPQSTIVVLQLRKPKIEPHIIEPPLLPSYIVPVSSNTITTSPILTPVVTNPRILPIQNASVICRMTSIPNTNTNATTIPNHAHRHSGSMLIGCLDGSVYYMNHMYSRPFITSRVTFFENNHGNNNNMASLCLPIVAMDHCLHDMTAENGRFVVVLSDGNLRIYHSHCPKEQQQEQHRHIDHVNSYNNQSANTLIPEDSESESHSKWNMNKSDRSIISHYDNPRGFQCHQIHNFRNYCTSTSTTFLSAKWICSTYLIAMEQPKNTESTIHVFPINDNGTNDNFLSPLSTMTMTRSLLEESSTDTFFNFDKDEPTIHDTQQQPIPASLEYDRYSDCVGVTSYLCIGNDSTSTRRRQFYSFSCLWKWKVNVLGYTMCYASNHRNETIRTASSYFGIDQVRRRTLVHVTSIYNVVQCSIRIQKESYHLAILSPPYESSYDTAHPRIRESTSLLLSATSISYPVISKTSNMKNYDIAWMESSIPNSYRSMYGAPQLATIGKKYGRSIAVASFRGLCVLDRGNDPHSTTTTTMHSIPKWRLFANENHEKQFRVVAFMWWEGAIRNKNYSKMNHEHVVDDDILVAVIEIMEGGKDICGHYLSCWSVRDIELSAQLIRSKSQVGDGMTTSLKWGLKLPTDFTPNSIDLLALPHQTTNDDRAISGSQRVATVMIADCSESTKYHVYQLRLVRKVSNAVNVHNIVVPRCIAIGRIGSLAELFVASSSFNLSHSERDDNSTADEYTVIGVIQKQGGGLDAILVSDNASTVLNIGRVIESNNNLSHESSRGEIAQYWLSDIIYQDTTENTSNMSNSFEWVFQLADGRLLSWSIPFSLTSIQLDPPFQYLDGSESKSAAKSVDEKIHTLGIVTPAGNVSSWMQQSTRGVQSNFLGGTVPQSAFGYIVGMKQSCKKVMSIGVNIDCDAFRTSLHQHTILRPGEITLYPPSFLPSIYVHAVEMPYEKERFKEFYSHLKIYVCEKMVPLHQQDMAVLSLQLIVLRVVERLTKFSQSHYCDVSDSSIYSHLSDRLTNIIEIVRCCTVPLQFTVFFITLARQMETSCLPHLFPLPETSEDLCTIAALYGSIPTSVSTLPILTNNKTTKMKCTDTFQACIDRLDQILRQPLCFDFDICMDEFNSIGEIFRYALKIAGNNIAMVDDSDSDDDGAARSFSIMCGMTKLFGIRNARSKKGVVEKSSNPAPLLIHGITDSKITKLEAYGVKHLRKLSLWQVHTRMDLFTNVPQVAARFIVSSIFGGGLLDSQIGWINVALLSTAVMSDMSSENCYSTINVFSNYVATIKVNHFLALAPSDVRREGMIRVFDYFINNCDDSMDPAVAGRIFDLVVVLLGCDVATFPADLPGLVVVATVAAHQADRILDILSPESDDALSIAYFELCSKQSAW